jgi:hypothetical protein
MEIKVKGIASYPKVMKSQDFKGDGNFKYSIDVLILKTDPQCADITNKIQEVIKNSFPNGAPKGFKTCLKDMAVEYPEKPAFKDYMVLKASTNADVNKPFVVDANKEQILDPTMDSQIFGQIVWMVGNLATYNAQSSGVKIYLNGVLATGVDGDIPLEEMSSKPSVSQMFAGIEETTPTPSFG